MGSNFTVTPGLPQDLDGIARFLGTWGASPPEDIWRELRRDLHAAFELGRQPNGVRRTLIVIDKLGMIRGFCMTQNVRHAVYPNILDVPVLLIEQGPNEDAICRTLFEYVTDLARETSHDAVRFHRSAVGSWWQALHTAAHAEEGVIVPLFERKAVGADCLNQFEKPCIGHSVHGPA